MTMTMAINPITDYNLIEHPCGMTVSNTMTLVTDRSTKPKGFAFALSCVPLTWVVTSPTFPTGGLFVTEVPLGMHHLGMDDELKDNSENDIDLGKLTPTHRPLEHTSPMGSEISNSEVELSNHDRHD